MADAADDKDAIEWTADVSLLGQPTMVVNFAKVILIAAAIMAGLLAYLTAANGRSDEILPLLELTAACCGGVAVVMLLVMLIVFRNRMTMAFHVDAKAAASAVVDRRARVGGNLAIAAGALAGNPQLLGAGLIARSNSATRVSWSAVRRLKVSRRWRTVSLVNSWRTALILYCTPETFDRVEALARAAVAATPPRKRKSPLPGLALRTVLTLVAGLPLLNLPDPIAVESPAPWLAICCALAAIWLLPLFGLATLGALVWIFGQALVVGFQPYHSTISDDTFARFGLMSDDDWIELAIAGVAAAYLAWLSLRLLAGRIESALMGDQRDAGD